MTEAELEGERPGVRELCVRFGTVAGTPVAKIDRKGSDMTIGVAVAPAFAKQSKS